VRSSCSLSNCYESKYLTEKRIVAKGPVYDRHILHEGKGTVKDWPKMDTNSLAGFNLRKNDDESRVANFA
jgi:hypothetical protein